MKLNVMHKKHKSCNIVDGNTLIEMEDGEKWKLKNIVILGKVTLKTVSEKEDKR